MERNYLGDAHQRDIEIIPGSTVTINSNGDSDRFATVHRMQTLGSMIGEKNKYTKFWIQTNSVHNFRNTS